MFPGYLRPTSKAATIPTPSSTDRERLLRRSTVGDTCRSRALERWATRRTPGALHRSVAREAAGGAGHRPTVDVRVDHADDPGPRVRVEAGPALVPTWTAFAVVNLLERHFDDARRLRLHRAHGGRPRRHRARQGHEGRGSDGSISATAIPGLKRLVEDNLGAIDAAEINSIPLGARPGRRTGGREAGALRPVREARRGHRVGAGGHRARRAHRREGARAPRGAQVATTRSAPTPRRACRCTRRTVATDRTCNSATGHLAHEREAEDGIAVQDDDPRTAHARRRRSSCSHFHACSAPIRPTAKSSRQATVGTARSFGRARTTDRSTPRSGSSRSRSTRRLRCSRNLGSTEVGAHPSLRSASSAPIRCPGVPSWRRTAASACT